MTITFNQEASPLLWLIEGVVTYKGDEFAFWYEYDGRCGNGEEHFEARLEFDDGEPNDDFDFEALAEACLAQVRKGMRVTKQLGIEKVLVAA